MVRGPWALLRESPGAMEVGEQEACPIHNVFSKDGKGQSIQEGQKKWDVRLPSVGVRP